MSLAVEFSTIDEMFDRLTERFADAQRPAILYKSEGSFKGISYSQLRTDVEMFACGLSALGAQRNDHIAIISENRPEWIVSDMAMLCLGIVSVPLYTTLAPKQIEFILNDAGVKFAIVSNSFQLNKVMSIMKEVKTLQGVIVMNERFENGDGSVVSFSQVVQRGKNFNAPHGGFIKQHTAKPDDLLTIIYTSGTTGNPKGVMLTHRNLVSNVHAAAECVPISSDDVFLSFLPLCHSFERMAGDYTAMSCGALIAYAESIETLRDNMLEVRPTIMTAVPRFFERLYNRLQKQIDSHPTFRKKIIYWAFDVGRKYVQSRKQKSVSPLLAFKQKIADVLVFRKIQQRMGGRLRFFVSGGAALSREIGEFFEAVGVLILEGYGLTESSPVISVNRIDKYKFGAVGIPIPGIEVKIADDGEILARGPNIMKGYWNNPQATAEMIDKDHWLHTGDIGKFDEQGFLVITDRKKHLFVSSGGKNIAPQPIENLFLQSRYIDQFVLIGDKRMFCSALIVPHFDAIKDYAKEKNIPYNNDEALVNISEIYNLIEAEVNTIQKDLAQYERVRKFKLLSQPLSVESGDMTPTLKIKRNVVESKYKYLIDTMYQEVV